MPGGEQNETDRHDKTTQIALFLPVPITLHYCKQCTSHPKKNQSFAGQTKPNEDLILIFPEEQANGKTWPAKKRKIAVILKRNREIQIGVGAKQRCKQ